MFKPHERTRRRLCQVFFLALCLLPTLGVLVGAAWIRSPAHRAAYEQRLRYQSGFDIAIDAVCYPRPGLVEYRGFRMTDPTSGESLLTCPLVLAESAGDQFTITLDGPKCSCNSWRALADAALRWVRTESQHSGDNLQVFATGAEIDWGTSHSAIGQIAMHVPGGQSSAELSGQVWTTGQPSDEPLRLAARCERQNGRATTRLELHTGRTALSAARLAALWPPFARLGSDCRVHGSLWTVHNDQGLSGEFAGEIAAIDLAALTAAPLPHGLTGLGDATIHSLRFENGVVQSAQVLFEAGPGTIDVPLIAAADALGLHATWNPIREPRSPASYQQMALALTIDGPHLAIEGRCQASGRGAVLVGQGGAIYADRHNPPRATAALASLLAPRGAPSVPISSGSAWLLAHLPSPTVEERPTARTANPFPQR